MRIQPMHINSFLLILAVFAWSPVASLAAGDNAQAKHAKISRAEAEKTALKQVPQGTIKEGELEKEGGRLIWSFDIATPGTKNIAEVHVDANTGEVVSQTTETPAKEARESAKEKRQSSGGSRETPGR